MFPSQRINKPRALDTLENVHAIWSRPVHLETVVEDKPRHFSFDGDEHKGKKL